MKQGEILYREGMPAEVLFAVSVGSFKTVVGGPEGTEQIAGFFIAGELVGLDGLSSGAYKSRATALEDSEVCLLAYSSLEQLGNEMPGFQRSLHAALSREILRAYSVMLMLSKLSARRRIAAFLLDLSARHAARGYAPDDFHLRMSRRDMGEHLGLRLETVSRQMGRLRDAGILEVDDKHVRVLDMHGLTKLAG